MSPQPARGLTLIELMMTLAVAGVLLTVAAPGFQQLLNSSRINGASQELAAAVHLGRAEAVRHNRRALLCRSTDGSACSGTANTWPGWILFIDANGNGERDTAEALIQAGSFSGPVQVISSPAITAVSERVVFRADGIARAADTISLLAGTWAICVPTTMPAQNVRELNLASGTRTTLRARNGNGACATPTDG